MATTSLFSKFCEYVDKTIFSEENMGGVVAFVVDKNYIDRFCETNGTTERELMLAEKAPYGLHIYLLLFDKLKVFLPFNCMQHQREEIPTVSLP
jgi:hypothetical protein